MTAGDGPVLGFDEAGAFSILPPAPRKIADVTGAGDALAGATIAALLRGLPLARGPARRHGRGDARHRERRRRAGFHAATFAEALALVPDAQEMA